MDALNRLFSGLGVRIQGAVAVLLLVAALAWAGVTNYDRLALGDSNYGTDPGSTNSLDIVLENDESIDGQTASTITFGRDDAGTVTLTSRDNDTTAALTIDAGGTSTLTLGSATDTVSLAATSGIALSNAETVSNGTDGTIFLGRNDAGTVTLSAKDDDATAALTVVPGGAAALTLGNTSTTSLTATLATGGDLTLTSDATGGNAGARSEIRGLPRMKIVNLGTMPSAAASSAETTSYTDDSSTGEYAPIDGDVTEAEGSTDSIYRVGSSSYKALFASSAAANDGFKRTITGDDLEANESIGFWAYSSVAIASADLQILLTDDGGARNFDISAIPATTWTWVEVDISGLTGGTGDVVTEFGITLTTQGATALAAFNLYIDGAFKWDASGEETLGVDVVQDGVLSCWSVVTTPGVTTTLDLVENTDYFVHYQSTDAIVIITDNNTESGQCMLAY